MRKIFAILLILGIAGAVCVHYSELFEKYKLGRVSFYFIYLTQAGILIRCYDALREIALSTLESVVLFIKLLAPTYFAAVAGTGEILTAHAGYEFVLFLIYGVEELLEKAILPLITLYFLFSVLEGLHAKKRLELMISLIGKFVDFSLKAAAGIFSCIPLLERLLTPTLDSVRGSALKKAVTAIPGVGNSAESVMEVAYASAAVVKNCMGVIMLVFLIFLCAVPVVRLFLYALLFQTAGAVMGIVCRQEMAKAAARAGETSLLLLKTVLCALLLFMIAIAVSAGGITTRI